MLSVPRDGAECNSAVLMVIKKRKAKIRDGSPARLVYRCTQALVASPHLLCDALIWPGRSATRATRTLKMKNERFILSVLFCYR